MEPDKKINNNESKVGLCDKISKMGLNNKILIIYNPKIT